MSWLILSLLSLISFVLYDVASRFVATRSESPRAFATIYNAVVAVLSLSIFYLDPTLPGTITPRVILLTLVGLVLWGINGRLEYFVKKHVEASTFAIVAKVAPVGTFLLALIFLHESLSVNKLLGVILIILANVLIFVNQGIRAILTPEGLRYTTMICSVLAFAWFFDALNVPAWGVATFSVLSFAVGSLISGLFPTISMSAIKRELTLTPLWQIAFLGSLNLSGYALMLKAFTITEASNVIPIATATAPFVVLLSFLLLKERDFLWRKFLAALITLGGIYFMR